MKKKPPLREMTLQEYFRWSLKQEVMKDAEKEGIKIVEKKTKPHIVPLKGKQDER